MRAARFRPPLLTISPLNAKAAVTKVTRTRDVEPPLEAFWSLRSALRVSPVTSPRDWYRGISSPEQVSFQWSTNRSARIADQNRGPAGDSTPPDPTEPGKLPGPSRQLFFERESAVCGVLINARERQEYLHSTPGDTSSGMSFHRKRTSVLVDPDSIASASSAPWSVFSNQIRVG